MPHFLFSPSAVWWTAPELNFVGRIPPTLALLPRLSSGRALQKPPQTFYLFNLLQPLSTLFQHYFPTTYSVKQKIQPVLLLCSWTPRPPLPQS